MVSDARVDGHPAKDVLDQADDGLGGGELRAGGQGFDGGRQKKSFFCRTHLIVWRLEPEVVSGVVARQQDQVNVLRK